VFKLIFRVVRDPSIAEDLVQETFLRVWNRFGQFDAKKGDIGSWMMGIARNRSIDYLRSPTARERCAAEFQAMENPMLLGNLEKELLTSHQFHRVQVALEGLSKSHRTVMLLAYFEGLSQTEIARRLNQPLGTVKTWVRTALYRLRDELGSVDRKSAARHFAPHPDVVHFGAGLVSPAVTEGMTRRRIPTP
jgi:RNA polymerase sigma-70 factor (ECF subfamily)